MLRHRCVCAMQIVSAALVLGACPPKDSATITYDQVGACNGYSQTTGAGGAGPMHAVTAGAGHAYVVFHITEIDNRKSSIPFTFDPAKTFINGSGDHLDPNLSFAADLGVFTVVPITVPAGQSRPVRGLAVAVVSASGGAAEANNVSYFLAYDPITGNPGLLFAKTNSSQTSWPQTDDCRTMSLTL